MKLLTLSVMLLLAAAGTANATVTIADVLKTRSELSTFTTAVLACPTLANVVVDASTAVTICAPSDQAFASTLSSLGLSVSDLLANQDLLCGLLEYHILPTVIRTTNVVSTATSLVTLLTGSSVTAQLSSGVVLINNAVHVIVSDIVAGGSIIHIVDSVLLPPTVAGVAAVTPVLSTLLLAVRSVPEVLKTVSSPLTSVTLFAPTDAAFVAGLASLGLTTAQLLANPTLLTQLLNFHIAPSVVLCSSVTAGPVSVTTAAGGNLVLQLVNGIVQINSAQVITANIHAGLSVVHVIDQLLLPPALISSVTGTVTTTVTNTIATVAAVNSDLSTFVAAVLACPTVLAKLNDPTALLTVFAPTNAAFQALLSSLKMTLPQLLANQQLLTSILESHIVPQVLHTTQITSLLNIGTLLSGAGLTLQPDSVGVLVNGVSHVIVCNVPAGASVVQVVDKVLMNPVVNLLLSTLGLVGGVVGGLLGGLLG